MAKRITHSKILWYAFFACIAASMPQSSYAELVTINFDDPAFNNYDHIPSTYGSTASLAVSYRSLYSDFSPYSNYLQFWDVGYSNLSKVAWPDVHPGVGEITFEAVGAGNLVTLNSFQLGSWPTSVDRTANLLRVLDGNGNQLFSAAGALIDGTTATSFLPDVSAPKLVLQWGYQYLAIDNIVVNTVPLPGAAILAVLGLGVAGHRLRKLG